MEFAKRRRWWRENVLTPSLDLLARKRPAGQRAPESDEGHACILKASTKKSISRRTLGDTNLREE